MHLVNRKVQELSTTMFKVAISKFLLKIHKSTHLGPKVLMKVIKFGKFASSI